ncbi:beta-galactosidase [Vallitalea longa]|uniref:Beta-galactosidase n=1 Tax=Vallitalea longa TaxID=2936439 RepID=A0A9W5YBB0_9FIRM|nr:sugar-binding domain-containing protein [Vallitalea longa]GKX28809.1 beta-galactosidase [Vallitalea longa]
MCLAKNSTGGFYAVKNSNRIVYNFNIGWLFHKGDIENAYKYDYDDSNFNIVHLPHGIELTSENASGMRNHQGVVWYRKHFTLDVENRNKRHFIYFDAVMGKCEVYLNGTLMTKHYGGYLPFIIDITHMVNYQKDNVITIKADNSDDDSYPPGKSQDNLDFTYLGGIYRNVYLIETDKVYVTNNIEDNNGSGSGVLINTLNINDKEAIIEVKNHIINTDSYDRKFSLKTILEDSDLNILLTKSQDVTLKSGQGQIFTQQITIENPHLWYPNDPYLHFIETQIIENDIIVDDLRTRFGIRTLEMCNLKGLYINNKPIGYKLSGVNRHQDYVYVGNALPDSGQRRDAMLIRGGGSNIVRAAHYPLSPAFMDACDELGLLVSVPNPGWQFYNENNPIFGQRVKEDTKNMVRRDRNRPSVLYYEIVLNETLNHPVSVIKEMHEIVHEELPYTSTLTAGDMDLGKKADLDFYFTGGKQENVKCTYQREYGDGGEVDNWISQNAATRVNTCWGEQALINQLLKRARQLDELYKTKPTRIGGSLWCGIDHQRGYHPDPFLGGLLDVYRIPRYSYYLYKSQYDADFHLDGIKTGPMIFIAHELTQISGRDVYIITNCDSVRLYWAGKDYGIAEPIDDFKWMPHPPIVFRDVFDFNVIATKYRDITNNLEMVVEGIVDSKVVCRRVKKYPERLTGVKLEIDDQGIDLIADGSDFVPVRAVLVDNKGIKKVLSSEYVHFTIEGEGNVIGNEVNYANPMKTQFGVATALIRSTTRPGSIKVKAYVNGLSSDEITINSIKPYMPFIYDDRYVNRTDEDDSTLPTIIKNEPNDINDMQELNNEIKRLKLLLTSKEQDIMELMGKI